MSGSLSRQVFNFVGGKNTEASVFNYPDNTAQTLTNFVLGLDGSVSRRLGLNKETNGSDYALDANFLSYAQFSLFEWKNAGGVADRTLIVIQFGYSVAFFDAANTNLSSGFIATVDLRPYLVNNVAELGRMTMSAGLGHLFVANKNIKPIYIEYDGVSAFTVNTITVQVRDFVGVDDGLEIDERPSTLSAAHEYNLRNQGWPVEFETVVGGPNDEPLAATYRVLGVYPSNADIMSFAKVDASAYASQIGKYSPRVLESNLFGNTKSPKGHFIIDAFTLDRSTASGITVPDSALKEATVTTRPSCCAFAHGRLWLAGLQDTDHRGKVFVSKLLDSPKDAGVCYQNNDPTAEELNALVATDGLVINIPEASGVSRLEVLGDYVVIVAETGIWAVKGGADTGFTAEAFTVSKVTAAGCDYSGSVVVADSTLFYWSDRGIYGVALDDAGMLKATNVSKQTIQTDYLAIPADSKHYALSFYDKEEATIYWLYHSEGNNITNSRFVGEFDSMLILDTRLGAFYDFYVPPIDANGPFILAMCRTAPFSTETFTLDVVDSNGNLVVDSAGNQVVAEVDAIVGATSTVKVVCGYRSGGGATCNVFAADFSDTDFLDWKFYDTIGVDAAGNIVTGHDVNVSPESKSGTLRKQATYVTTHFKQTETALEDNGSGLEFDRPSGCYMRARWDFSNTSGWGKWSTNWEVYRLNRLFIPSAAGAFSYGREVVTTRNKVRGSGKAIQLEFTTRAGKDCQLLGWEAGYGISSKP